MATINVLSRAKKPAKPASEFNNNSVILYRGPSLLDGSPIIVIVSGIEKGSDNGKTGAMLQTFILRDDMTPLEAVKTGADSAICGGCAHRGDVAAGRKRSCYVTVMHAPHNTWKTAHRGRYREVTSAADISAIGRGRKVRLGSYGDPAAVPVHIWQALLANALPGHTGYSHQWRKADAAPFAQLTMASVDRPSEYAEAKAMGWRTFRVKAAEQPVFPNEVVCPASEEAGKRTTCENCRLCGGLSTKTRKDIVINSHGTSRAAGEQLSRS
jgi:hypothetical protein